MADKVYAVTFRRVQYTTVYVTVDEFDDYPDVEGLAEGALNKVQAWQELTSPAIVSTDMLS